MQGKYGVRHTFRMSQYESIEVTGELIFDFSDDGGSFNAARIEVDNGLRDDLERIKHTTNFSPSETYVHEWTKIVYA